MTTLTTDGLFSITNRSAGLRIAQVVGLTSSAAFFGYSIGLTFTTAPALLLSPAPLLAKQWKTMRDSDILSPAVVPLGVGVFGWLAMREPRNSLPFILYTASASLLALCVPYNLFMTRPTERKLTLKAEELANVDLLDTNTQAGATAAKESVHQLVDRWAMLNFGRTVLLGLAANLSIWAAVNRLEIVPVALEATSFAKRLGL